MTTPHKIVDGVEAPLTEEDLAQMAADAAAVPEQQWSVVRAERNAKLAASDWTQLPDTPVDAAAWATYRQALRDITDQEDPFNILWPEQP